MRSELFGVWIAFSRDGKLYTQGYVTPPRGWAGRGQERRSDMRMRAYYYGFDATGVSAIDRILCAVASAGKAFHHTEQWCEECAEQADLEGKNPVQWIQNAANAAAQEMKANDP